MVLSDWLRYSLNVVLKKESSGCQQNCGPALLHVSETFSVFLKIWIIRLLSFERLIDLC